MCKKKGWVTWEILLGVVLLLALLGLCASKGGSVIDMGKEARASGDTAALGAAISEYNVEIGTYPATLTDLTKKNEQYGPWMNQIAKDPWGNAYVYVKNADGFVVYSYGSNKVDDGSRVNKIAQGDIGFTGK